MTWINDDTPSPTLVREGIMSAAYPSSPLGNPHFCPVAAVPNITGQGVKEWRDRFFRRGNMFVGAAGIEHAKIVDIVGELFKDVPAGKPEVREGRRANPMMWNTVVS